MDSILRTGVGLGVLLTLAACVTAPQSVREREAYWREILAERTPVGAPKSQVAALFTEYQLPMAEGTYRTALPDGGQSSNCRLPDRAVSAIERGAVRGLYIKWDIEVTVCLDERDTVESHFVGAWNAGI